MTNKASEDELRANIDKALHIDWAFNKSKPTRIIIDGSATKGAYHTSYGLFVDNILDLIRTEKLKLLAAVRERVVGEEDFYDTKERTLLRTQQLEELTKLEAEL